MSDGSTYLVYHHWCISDCGRAWSRCMPYSMGGWSPPWTSSSRHEKIQIVVATASDFVTSCPIWHAASVFFLSALSNRGTSCSPNSMMLPWKEIITLRLDAVWDTLFPNTSRTPISCPCTNALSWLFGVQVPLSISFYILILQWGQCSRHLNTCS